MELLIVLSDSHGHLADAERVIRSWPMATRIVHLGDYLRDALLLRKLFPDLVFDMVPGNGDFSVDPEQWPAERILELEGRRILLTHGNRYGVKEGLGRLFKRTRTSGCDLALFGHTHEAVDLAAADVRLVNPGSIGLPRYSATPTYALIEVADGKIEVRLMEAT